MRDRRAVGQEGGAGRAGIDGQPPGILVDRGHRTRFVYTPKHSSWLNQIEVVFGVIMRKVIRRGSFTSVADLRSKLVNFIAYFNEVFAKPFNWTYTGRPLRVKPAA